MLDVIIGAVESVCRQAESFRHSLDQRIRGVNARLAEAKESLMRVQQVIDRRAEEVGKVVREVCLQLNEWGYIIREYPEHVECTIIVSHLEEGFEESVSEWLQVRFPKPMSDANDVLVPLSEKQWLKKDRPIRYLRARAKTNRIAAGKWRWGKDKRAVLSLTDDAVAALVPSAPESDTETRLLFEDVVEAAGLSRDERELFQARVDQVTRQEATDYLGWSEQKVNRVWRSLGRKRDRLRRAMRSDAGNPWGGGTHSRRGA